MNNEHEFDDFEQETHSYLGNMAIPLEEAQAKKQNNPLNIIGLLGSAQAKIGSHDPRVQIGISRFGPATLGGNHDQ